MPWCCGSAAVKDESLDSDAGGATSHKQAGGGSPGTQGQWLSQDEERRLLSAEAGPSGRSKRWTTPSKQQHGFSPRKGQIAPLPVSPTASLAARLVGLTKADSGSSRRGSGSDFTAAASDLSTLRHGSHIHPFGVPQISATASATSAPGSRPLAVDELRDLSFPCFSATSLPPTTSQLPVAVLVLESVDDQPASQLKASQAGIAEDSVRGPGKRVPNNLVPVHINSACSSYFSISGHKDYVSVIRKLLQRDPLLTFALQKALRNLKTGDANPVSHVTPDPSGQTSTLFGMRITPCVWEDPPTPPAHTPSHAIATTGRPSGLSAVSFPSSTYQHAALLIEHNMPYNAAEVMPRLMRDYAVLSHVPAILTLIDFQGKVLYQNASSLAYMGDLLSVKYDSVLAEGLLRLLFTYDMNNMEAMLDEVLQGQEWQGVVQVPASMRRFLSAANMAANPNSSQSVSHHPSMLTGSFTARHDDELEVEFQIGNSFTTRGIGGKHRHQQKKTAQFLVPRQTVRDLSSGQTLHRNHSTAAVLHQAAGSALRAEAAGGDSVAHSGRSITGQRVMMANNSMPAMHEDGFSPAQSAASAAVLEAPNQRRFMTLLEKASHSPRQTNSVLQRVSSLQDPSTSGDHALDSRVSAEASLHNTPGSPLDPPLQSRLTSRPTSGLNAVGLLTAEEEQDDLYQESAECYHEIHAIPLLDPVLDKQVIMLVQTDVTPRVELENKLADLTDAQLSMLEQLFPRHIIEYMLAGVPSKGGRNLRDLANTHDQVMVLFCDVVGFTSMSKEVEPSQVMHFLNELYEAFDALVDDYDMYKLDIVGDCYIVVAGLIKEDQDGFVCVDEMDTEQVYHNAEKIMEFAKAMLRESRMVLMPHDHNPVQLRIGIHTGPLVSGLVGAKMPKFTLFGDTMNTASRMESTCKPGCVHVSDAFARLLPHEVWHPTGGVQVKGKGLMQTCIHVPESLPTPKQPSEISNISRKGSNVGHPQLSKLTSFHSRGSMLSEAGNSDGPAGERVGYGTQAGSRNHNPLMTILTNIMGGEEDSSPGSPNASEGMPGKSHSSTVGRYRQHSHYMQNSGDGAIEVDGKRPSDGYARGSMMRRRPSDDRDSSHERRTWQGAGRGPTECLVVGKGRPPRSVSGKSDGLSPTSESRLKHVTVTDTDSQSEDIEEEPSALQ